MYLLRQSIENNGTVSNINRNNNTSMNSVLWFSIYLCLDYIIIVRTAPNCLEKNIKRKQNILSKI